MLSLGGSGYFTCKQNMKLVTTKFKSGGLHEKHVVATWNFGNHLSICLQAQGNQEKLVSRWPVAGPSEYWPVASSPAFKVKKKPIHTYVDNIKFDLNLTRTTRTTLVVAERSGWRRVLGESKRRPSAKGAHLYRKLACLEALRLATT